MAINYDFYKSSGVFSKDSKWHVRLVENGTAKTSEIMENIERATSLTVADLKGAFDALISQIAQQLENGRNVHIEGLGHFSLSIGGEVVENDKGELRLKNAAVRTVNFRPEPSLLSNFSNASFSSKQHRGHHSTIVDETALPNVLTDLCAEKGYFTRADFRKALKLTVPTGNRLLSRLLNDGILKNVGSRHFGMFQLR